MKSYCFTTVVNNLPEAALYVISIIMFTGLILAGLVAFSWLKKIQGKCRNNSGID